jgi:hypothetical protein
MTNATPSSSVTSPPTVDTVSVSQPRADASSDMAHGRGPNAPTMLSLRRSENQPTQTAWATRA